MALLTKPTPGATLAIPPRRLLPGRSPTLRRHWPAFVCGATYLVLAVVRYGDPSSIGSDHVAGPTVGSDTVEQIWWLAWVAHAMPHLHAVLLGEGQNYPFGQNFGVQGSMLALGVIFAPITKLFGPVVTWNVLVRLAPAVSAMSMCLVLRRWTKWWPAAFLGGLLYAFSAYLASLSSYLFLIFVPLPPLIFLLLHEIFVRQRWRPGRTGIALGLVCTLQFFISTEVLASTFVIGILAVALVLVLERRSLATRLHYMTTAAGSFLGVACVLLAYPLLYTFTGPQHINGSPASPAYLAVLTGNLWSPLVPSAYQWLNPSWVPHGARGNSVGGFYGDLLYLGLPLVLALASFAILLRRRKEILFAGTMAFVAYVLALGAHLVIGSDVTPVPLPFALLTHLPALNGLQATRFALFVDLFAAAMFAIGIDELWWRLKRSRGLKRIPSIWRNAIGVVSVGGLALVVCLPLLPRATQPSPPTAVPKFFTSSALDAIPNNSVVLTYPYPDLNSNIIQSIDLEARSPVLDQAVAGMRFRVIGGYGWFPSPDGGKGTIAPALLRPQSVQALFDSDFGAGTPAQQALLSKGTIATDLPAFLRKYRVQTVLIPRHPGRKPQALPPRVVSSLTAAIGPPVTEGGVTIWTDVQKRLASHN